MKPFRIFFFGLSVFLLLFVASVVINNINLVIFGVSVKFPSFYSFVKVEKPHYKDISHIIRFANSLEDTVKPLPRPDSVKSVKHLSETHKAGKQLVKTDSLHLITRDIEFPAGADTVLFPFFNQISGLQNSGKLVRILHYGDSQIEGDRITSYLRNQLQSRFGGSGIGLFPILSCNPASISFVYDVSNNWEKFSPLPGSMLERVHHRYGALVNFARLVHNSSIFSRDKELNGWIELKYPNIPYPLAQQSQLCRIFYGFNKSPMMVELTQNKSVIDAEMVPPSSSLKELRWNLASPRNILISFTSSESPDIYGISLDGGHGIAVDNIPLRGSSGLEFTKTDLAFLSDFYRLLNVKLLILQFGVNIVPNVTSNYEYYEKSFYKQLIALKKTVPGLSILVMGVSDVSRNGENGFESFPNIEKIRDAQKKASFDAGCAFWDLFEAMGGKNSMPSWVFANPPLAQKDFVHFNPMGAKIIGEMFYRSFMREYERYLETKQKNKEMAVLK